MELTLEQMLIELQQRWGDCFFLAANNDGTWELTIEGEPWRVFDGKTPHSAVIQAFREATDAERADAE